MNIKTIQCKTLLTKSNLPEVDYCINPYVGCLHGCVYCYARFMKRFTGHSEKWGDFLDVKINAPEVLEKKMARNPKKGTILLGSVTDSYQPIERKYKLTRQLLEILLQYDFPISILTKSDLVTRDIDLLTQFNNCEVGLTITSWVEGATRDFEPRASSMQQRVDALETLHNSGIKTYAFISPILPDLTKLEDIFIGLKGKVDFIMAESLNMKCGNKQDIEKLLSIKYPHLLPAYSSGFTKDFWDKVGKELRKLSKETNIPLKGFYRH